MKNVPPPIARFAAPRKPLFCCPAPMLVASCTGPRNHASSPDSAMTSSPGESVISRIGVVPPFTSGCMSASGWVAQGLLSHANTGGERGDEAAPAVAHFRGLLLHDEGAAERARRPALGSRQVRAVVRRTGEGSRTVARRDRELAGRSLAREDRICGIVAARRD